MRPDSTRSTRAFTLIEVLLAITIAVALSGLAMAGFMQMRQVVKRNQVMTDLAQEAAYIQRRLEQDLATCNPGGQMRFERIPSIAAAGSGYLEYGLRVSFLGQVPNLTPSNGNDNAFDTMYKRYRNTTVWYGWEWRPPATSTGTNRLPGTFLTGRSSIGDHHQTRTLTTPSGATRYEFYILPEVRRSSQRDRDDNDLRLLPNIDVARSKLTDQTNLLPGRGLVTGDYTDLFGEDTNGNGILDATEKDENQNGVLNLGQMAPLSRRMTALKLSWVDFGGSTTALSTADGISPAGGNADVRVVDGLYRDGRDPTVLAQRPSVLRVVFTLADAATGINRTFSFSFCIGLDSVTAIGVAP